MIPQHVIERAARLAGLYVYGGRYVHGYDNPCLCGGLTPIPAPSSGYPNGRGGSRTPQVPRRSVKRDGYTPPSVRFAGEPLTRRKRKVRNTLLKLQARLVRTTDGNQLLVKPTP